MADTKATSYLDTPAAVACAVLDAIEAHPGSLLMSRWATLPHGELKPGDAVQCGTTLCIAGWAAHLTGYTLRSDGEMETSVYATKDGREYEVEDVAAAALGLAPNGTGMFWDPASEALARLRAIAGR